MTALIEVRNIVKILPTEARTVLVNDISLNIHAGRFVSIIGPSGSGKSSLLYLLGLLDSPTSGVVKYRGEAVDYSNVANIKRIRLEKIGFVFQFHFLLPEFTALENVMIPMKRLAKLTDAESVEKAEYLLNTLNLYEHKDKFPKQLSGGQSQRVAVARALANDPEIIFADEPTGNLDSKNSEGVQEMLQHLVDDHNKALVVVTHDDMFANKAHEVVHIKDGRIDTLPRAIA